MKRSLTWPAARLRLSPNPPAYARVDGLIRPGQGFLITEVELIEPALFLHLYPDRAIQMTNLLL